MRDIRRLARKARVFAAAILAGATLFPQIAAGVPISMRYDMSPEDFQTYVPKAVWTWMTQNPGFMTTRPAPTGYTIDVDPPSAQQQALLAKAPASIRDWINQHITPIVTGGDNQYASGGKQAGVQVIQAMTHIQAVAAATSDVRLARERMDELARQGASNSSLYREMEEIYNRAWQSYQEHQEAIRRGDAALGRQSQLELAVIDAQAAVARGKLSSATAYQRERGAEAEAFLRQWVKMGRNGATPYMNLANGNFTGVDLADLELPPSQGGGGSPTLDDLKRLLALLPSLMAPPQMNGVTSDIASGTPFTSRPFEPIYANANLSDQTFGPSSAGVSGYDAAPWVSRFGVGREGSLAGAEWGLTNFYIDPRTGTGLLEEVARLQSLGRWEEAQRLLNATMPVHLGGNVIYPGNLSPAYYIGLIQSFIGGDAGRLAAVVNRGDVLAELSRVTGLTTSQILAAIGASIANDEARRRSGINTAAAELRHIQNLINASGGVMTATTWAQLNAIASGLYNYSRTGIAIVLDGTGAIVGSFDFAAQLNFAAKTLTATYSNITLNGSWPGVPLTGDNGYTRVISLTLSTANEPFSIATGPPVSTVAPHYDTGFTPPLTFTNVGNQIAKIMSFGFRIYDPAREQFPGTTHPNDIENDPDSAIFGIPSNWPYGHPNASIGRGAETTATRP